MGIQDLPWKQNVDHLSEQTLSGRIMKYVSEEKSNKK